MASANTCNDWTSSDPGVAAMLGHFDRMGVAGNIDPMSFVEAHASQGCAVASFSPTGGRGSIY